MITIERPHKDAAELGATVRGVLNDIKSRGDDAVKEYELKFDKVQLNALKVTDEEIEEAEKLVSDELRDALVLAHKNICAFHSSQRFEIQHSNKTYRADCSHYLTADYCKQTPVRSFFISYSYRGENKHYHAQQ